MARPDDDQNPPLVTLRESLKVGITPGAMIHLLHAAKALAGRRRGLASLPSGPTLPFPAYALSLTFQGSVRPLGTNRRTKPPSSLACPVALWGYANVADPVRG